MSAEIAADSARRLGALAGRLAPVTLIPHGAPLPSWRPSRLNQHLHPALKLAELVLAGCSVRAEPGDTPIRGLLVNMATLFEDFLASEVRRQLTTQFGGRVDQHRTDFLD